MQDPTPDMKFVIEDPIEIREKLVGSMAICIQPERLIQWYRYDVVDSDTKKLRGHVELKVEEGRVVMNYKALENSTSDAELTVSSFEAANKFLQAVGMVQRNFQEKKRETWELDNIKAHIDQWPWLGYVLVLENGTDETIQRFGLADKQRVDGSIDRLYIDKYNIDLNMFLNMPELKFMKRPDWA